MLLFALILSLLSFESNGQKKKKRRKQAALSTYEIPDDIIFSVYDFKNINKIPEYQNKDLKQRILKLQADRDWPKLHKALKVYVGNFGIQNFYKDTYWIWRLAKLTELYEGSEAAKPLYRLALRHHHNGINVQELEIYYDSLNNQEKDLFVPLDYYYQLVEHRKGIDTLRPPRGVLLNMGPSVNSRKADYGPSLGINRDVLLFTSKRNEVTRGLKETDNEDLFITKIDGNQWGQSIPMEQINTPFNEGSACLSRDGRTLYFSRCESPDGLGNCDLYVAELRPDSTWTNIRNMGVNVNSVSWDSHPSLSHGEDTLYFASDRIGGFGLSDIYFTYKKGSGEWAAAQNLGPIVNTRNNDVSPFYHPFHEVLYFSSNGQLYNFGEFDIYKTFKNEKAWSEPINIGPLVNGKGSEFYFTIDSKSEDLFYARSAGRDLNKLDLYSFPLPMEGQPLATVSVTGSLTDSLTGKPFTGIVSIIDVDEGLEVAPKFLRPDGSFEFDLINNRNYLLVIQGDEFFRIEEMFYLDGPTRLDKVTEPIASRVKFESIEFDNGASQLKTEMYGDLNKIVNFLYDNPDFKLRISGHTDSSGNEDSNLQLSKDRAETIRDYIVVFGGVETERVEFGGYGSAKPLVDEKTEADKALNRRVEFEIYRPAPPDSPDND
ncbi:MAG: OmpA family protein [Bacteroidota bacterium]